MAPPGGSAGSGHPVSAVTMLRDDVRTGKNWSAADGQGAETGHMMRAEDVD